MSVKRRFHYSELTVVTEWSKDTRASEIPHLRLHSGHINCEITIQCFSISREKLIEPEIILPRFANSHLLWITTDSQPPIVCLFGLRLRSSFSLSLSITKEAKIDRTTLQFVQDLFDKPQARMNDYQTRIKICVVFADKWHDGHRWKSSRAARRASIIK